MLETPEQTLAELRKLHEALFTKPDESDGEFGYTYDTTEEGEHTGFEMVLTGEESEYAYLCGLGNHVMSLVEWQAAQISALREALDLVMTDFTEQEDNPRLEGLLSMIKAKKALASSDPSKPIGTPS